MKRLIIPLIIILAALGVVADFGPLGTITQVAQQLNYVNSSDSVTVDVFYNCTGTRVFNVTFPAGFTLGSTGAPCGLINSSLASCTFSGSPFNQGSYTFTGSDSTANHSITELPTFLSNTSSCGVVSNVSMVNINDAEIFHTLVEFGRGRGNYFYSTAFAGAAGSGHTGLGCPYVPNGTMFELNFLHKVFNIKQYYNDANSLATDATFTCSYPNSTIVRTHLGTSITRGANTTVSYAIDEIEGSWERTGYLGMDFDTGENDVGDNLTITCSDIKYTLANQGGNISVYSGGSTFNLEVRSPQPLVASASTTSVVGNGTQEVVITYNITNTEVYQIDDVILEIDSPPFADFIGTRSELWGTAQDQYRTERISMGPGDSHEITLVARFDTTLAPNSSTILLSEGIRAKYVTCWDINAYNPAETVQNIVMTDTATLNMGLPAEIAGIFVRLQQILNITKIINSTTISINNTVSSIENLVTIINSTTTQTNILVQQINTTLFSALNNTNTAINNTVLIINNTNTILELIDCDGINDSAMCADLDSINSTATNIQNIILQINQTLNNLTINVTIDLSGQNLTVNVTANLTNITNQINDIIGELDCSNVTNSSLELCNRAERIENNTIVLNNSINNINTLLQSFNTTVFGNITLQDIIDAMQNVSVDTTTLLNEIESIREFDEELIFLITDSFNLQQQAANDFLQGDANSAAAKLRAANSRLDQAMQRLVEQRQETEAQLPSTPTGMPAWMFIALALIVGLVVVYMWRRQPER
jgi:hypothetical protein